MKNIILAVMLTLVAYTLINELVVTITFIQYIFMEIIFVIGYRFHIFTTLQTQQKTYDNDQNPPSG